jgi:hypothetical protein
MSFWLPAAGVALAGVVATIAPKAQIIEQTYLSVQLKPMEKISRKTLDRLEKKTEASSLDDHDDLISEVVENLGYDHVFATGDKHIFEIPSSKSVVEAQKELMGLGIVENVTSIVVDRPQRPIESRIATIIPVSAGIFASGFLLGSPWSGFFTALVVLTVAQHTSRYTKTIAGITIPLLMTIPSAIIGFYTDSPVAAFFHAAVVGSVFEFVARKNTFGSYFAKQQLSLDRGSLLTMIGLPMAALSVATLWTGWPVAGFFGLVILALIIEGVISASSGTPKDSAHIKIKVG